MILYLSGPMRGYPDFNFPLFDKVAASLRSQGFAILNPAEHDRELYPDIDTWPGFAEGDVEKCPRFVMSGSLAWDFQSIIDGEGIALLPGWELSSGAKAERFVAECVGKTIHRVVPVDAGGYTLIADARQVMEFPLLRVVPK